MKNNKYYIEITCQGEFAILNSKTFRPLNNKYIFYKTRGEANKVLMKINNKNK